MCVTLSPPGQKITAPPRRAIFWSLFGHIGNDGFFIAKSECVHLTALRGLFSR
jgi:hypothetical protein